MDRKNGVAPPRPPKYLPRNHRPRAPEPVIAEESPSIHTISAPFPCIQSHTSKMSNNAKETINISNSINASLSSITTSSSHQSIPPLTTAPLTPLQNNRITSSGSSTGNSHFHMELPELLPIPTLNRSLTPTSLVSPGTFLINNSLNSVAGRTSSDGNNVSLQLPRPEIERLPNEYVDTPCTGQKNKKVVTTDSHHPFVCSTASSRDRNNITSNLSTLDEITNKNSLHNQTETPQRLNFLPITKQPSFRKKSFIDKNNVLQCNHSSDERILFPQNSSNNGLIISHTNDQLNSITCPQCSRCRCEECQRPRQLPSKWICDDNCYCSAETIIDYASCLCCVKALFYHCSKDHEFDCENETIRCAEDPCSCVSYKRASRWGCLSVLSIFLPCLCFYWPMRGCIGLCAKCYTKYSRHGCRCSNKSCSNSTSNCNNSFNSHQIIVNLSSPSQDQQDQLLKPRCGNNPDEHETVSNRWKFYGLSDADLYL
jgi:protein sprouty homolog 2